MSENAQTAPTREEMVKFFSEQIEMKELQLKLQEINTRYAVAKAEELKALSFIAQMTNPKPTDVVSEENTVPHIITQEDLDNNPDLVEYGVKVGDEVRIPKEDQFVQEEGGPLAMEEVKKEAPKKTLKKKD
jgi:hypothetical protein